MIRERGALQSRWLDTGTQQTITDESEAVYARLANQFNSPYETIHRVGLCVPASNLLKQNLRAKNIIAVHARAPTWKYHVYLALTEEGLAEPVVIDPTWQQFLEEGQTIPEETPKVLIGTSQEVIAIAQQYEADNIVATMYPPL